MKNYPAARLSDLCDIQIGRTPSRAETRYWGMGYPWLSIADMSQGPDIYHTKEQITEAAVHECNCTTVATDTVLLSFKLSLGKVSIARIPLFTNEAIAALTIKNASMLDPIYLSHVLRTCRLGDSSDRAAMGATLNKASLAQVKIPLPPLDQQRRIAAILNQAEKLRAKRRRGLAKLDTLTQSLFTELEGDRQFEFRTIAELLDSQHLLVHKDGNHGSQYPRADDFGEDGVAFLSVKDITADGEVNLKKVSHLRSQKADKLKIGWIESGDILLAHNASVGRVGIYRGQFGKALIGTSLTCFRPNALKMRSAFLAASLRSEIFQNQLARNMGQTTRNQVPITAQKKLTLPIAPLESQLEFEEKMQAIGRLRFRCGQSADLCDRIFNSLQSRAFQGEL